MIKLVWFVCEVYVYKEYINTDVLPPQKQICHEINKYNHNVIVFTAL